MPGEATYFWHCAILRIVELPISTWRAVRDCRGKCGCRVCFDTIRTSRTCWTLLTGWAVVREIISGPS
jgi:hypothetical protein